MVLEVLQNTGSYHLWKKFVEIENETSKIKEILTGVTQGPVLDPLLFLIYTNFLISKTYHFEEDESIMQSNKEVYYTYFINFILILIYIEKR